MDSDKGGPINLASPQVFLKELSCDGFIKSTSYLQPAGRKKTTKNKQTTVHSRDKNRKHIRYHIVIAYSLRLMDTLLYLGHTSKTSLSVNINQFSMNALLIN